MEHKKSPKGAFPFFKLYTYLHSNVVWCDSKQSPALPDPSYETLHDTLIIAIIAYTYTQAFSANLPAHSLLPKLIAIKFGNLKLLQPLQCPTRYSRYSHAVRQNVEGAKFPLQIAGWSIIRMNSAASCLWLSVITILQHSIQASITTDNTAARWQLCSFRRLLWRHCFAILVVFWTWLVCFGLFSNTLFLSRCSSPIAVEGLKLCLQMQMMPWNRS